MMNRRAFLECAAGATVTLVLTPLVGACSSSSTYGTSTSSTPNEPSCSGLQPTSSVAESHVHTVCVPTSDLTSPPAAGATYPTSITSDHAHAVSLTAAQLAAIRAGTTVTVITTSVVDPQDGVAHTHGFTITKASAPPPAPTAPSRGGGGYGY